MVIMGKMKKSGHEILEKIRELMKIEDDNYDYDDLIFDIKEQLDEYFKPANTYYREMRWKKNY